MVIFPLAPDQTIAQMWSNGARGSDMVGSRQSISECYAQNFESCDSNNAWGEEALHSVFSCGA